MPAATCPIGVVDAVPLSMAPPETKFSVEEVPVKLTPAAKFKSTPSSIPSVRVALRIVASTSTCLGLTSSC